MRRTVIAVLALVTAGVAGVGALAAQPASVELAQDDETPSAVVVERVSLALGERYSNGEWELEVQDAFVADSDDRAAFVEVRASVAFRALSGATLPYEWAAFTGMSGYPTLQIVDGDDVVYPIDVFEAGTTMVPGSDLIVLDPFIPARWTVGFEANDVQSDSLMIQAVWNGDVVAEWDVYSVPQPLAGWEPPPSSSVTAGEFGWSDDLFVTLLDSALVACGDPDTQPVYVQFQTGFSVANEGVVDSYFPNVRYPETTAIAVWADGSSAQSRVLDPTAAGIVGEIADEDTVALNGRNLEQLIVPGSSVLTGAFYFDLPRDGRFGDVTEYPDGIMLYPPDSDPQWIDVAPGIGTQSDICIAPNTVWQGGTSFQAQRPGA